jgi:hypothetical protein
MAYEMKDMSGSVFKNKKRDRDTSPNLTGSALIFGKEVWVNAWVKEDKNGDKWISFAFKEKQPQGTSSAPKQTPSNLDDSIPF